MSQTAEKKVVLRCSKNDCCPSITFNDDGSVDIEDQDDGRDEHVHLSQGQAAILKAALNNRIL